MRASLEIGPKAPSPVVTSVLIYIFYLRITLRVDSKICITTESVVSAKNSVVVDVSCLSFFFNCWPCFFGLGPLFCFDSFFFLGPHICKWCTLLPAIEKNCVYVRHVVCNKKWKVTKKIWKLSVSAQNLALQKIKATPKSNAKNNDWQNGPNYRLDLSTLQLRIQIYINNITIITKLLSQQS